MKKYIPLIIVAAVVYYISKKKKDPIIINDPGPSPTALTGGSSLYGVKRRFLPLHING